MVFEDKMHNIIKVIENDGVILFPTDTVWGLGCSPFSEEGFNKLKKIKGKNTSHHYILLVNDIKMLKKYIDHIHPRVETLLDYHTKPLSIVFPRAKNIPEFICQNNHTIAFRLTQDPFCKTIIDLLGHPILSTLPVEGNSLRSINYSDLDEKLIKKVDYVCWHNRNIIKDTLPSVMLTYDKEGDFKFLRN